MRLGPLGTREWLEPRLRGLTAARMGIPESWLRPDVSFEHDLAVDGHQVMRLVLDVERAMDVQLRGDAIDRMRTYGDLVDLVVEARLRRSPSPPPPVLARVALVPPPRSGRAATVVWTIPLTPYAIESVGDHVRRVARDGVLDVTLPADAPPGAIEWAERFFAPLGSRVAVRVRRDRITSGRAVA